MNARLFYPICGNGWPYSVFARRLTGDLPSEISSPHFVEVVASDLLFGLAWMFDAYQQIAGEREIRIVTDMNEARAWIGLPKEES